LLPALSFQRLQRCTRIVDSIIVNDSVYRHTAWRQGGIFLPQGKDTAHLATRTPCRPYGRPHTKEQINTLNSTALRMSPGPRTDPDRRETGAKPWATRPSGNRFHVQLILETLPPLWKHSDNTSTDRWAVRWYLPVPGEIFNAVEFSVSMILCCSC
jgi:hypothetical protein